MKPAADQPSEAEEVRVSPPLPNEKSSLLPQATGNRLVLSEVSFAKLSFQTVV